jgi:hypothetical protein
MSKFFFAFSKNLILLCAVFQISPSYSQIPSQPPNSYSSGQSWFCNNAYRKVNNQCINVFTETSEVLSQVIVFPVSTNLKEQNSVKSTEFNTDTKKIVEKKFEDKNIFYQISNSRNEIMKDYEDQSKKKQQSDRAIQINNPIALSDSLPSLKGQ